MKDLLLPHFIIIGAMKSGTTTLYRHLDEHPEVDMSRDKETDFFVSEKNWSRGLSWYSRQFTRADAVRGEASPNYSKSRDFSGVPKRMAEVCPDAKLIYILRDPIDRAQSQFSHSVVMGALSPDLTDFKSKYEYGHILDGSRYAEQLDVYFEYFERDAILILDFAELVSSPQIVMDKVTAHIGVAARPLTNTDAKNTSTEMSRVPSPILRFAQSQLGRHMTGMMERGTRDRIRRALARRPSRRPPAFSDGLRMAFADDLRADAERLRAMTGLSFPTWSV